MWDTLKGWGEFGLLLAKASSPAYALVDPEGSMQAQRELAGIVTEVGKLTTIYLMINPRAAVEAHKRLWLGLIGWDTMRTGNLPRWGGQLTPDAIVAATGGEMASVARARAAARGAATATHAGAEAAKPRIAAHIEDVARQTRGIPVGQQWWVKSQESLTRKILEDMRAKGVSAEDAAGLVNDALRFTITYPGESLTGSVESALDRLRGQLKQQTHGLYEVVRDPGYPLAVRQRAHEELVRLSSGLEHPPEIERIGTLKTYRRPGG